MFGSTPSSQALFRVLLWVHGVGIFMTSPSGASQLVLVVKKPPAIQETEAQSQVPEDPMEKGMATHSRILAWRIPWTEEPGGIQFMGLQRVGHDLARTHAHLYQML